MDGNVFIIDLVHFYQASVLQHQVLVLLRLSSIVNSLAQIHVKQLICLLITLMKLEVNSSTIFNIPDRVTEYFLMFLNFKARAKFVDFSLFAE